MMASNPSSTAGGGVTGNDLRVILVDEDLAQRRIMREALESYHNAHILAETDNLFYGYDLVRQNKPTIVFVDVRSDVSATLDVVKRINTYVRDTLVIVSGPEPDRELMHQFMAAGARDYLTRPLMTEGINQCLNLHLASLFADTTHGDDSGRIITVFSNKGGLGKTTTAINLALALAQVTGQSVALADLNLQLGDVSTFLDITPRQTIVDLVRNVNRLDAAYLKNSLHQYQCPSLAPGSGSVYVLADSPRMEDAEEITSGQINSVLTVLKNTFPYVVIDAPGTIDAKSVVSLDMADYILLTAIINLPSIRSTQRTLSLFSRLGYPAAKTKLLINRFVEGEEISIEDVEDTLGVPVFWRLPNEYFNVIKAINRGVPLAEINPNSPIWQELLQMAHALCGKLPQGGSEALPSVGGGAVLPQGVVGPAPAGKAPRMPLFSGFKPGVSIFGKR
jgi:pilus assembly protein CpaE